MVSILVTSAGSGATAEAAAQIAGDLRAQGHRVMLVDCESAGDARHFDAVVVGSEVRGHHQWAKAAMRYLRAQAPDLAERPTFVFQCPRSAGGATPHTVRTLVYEIGAGAPHTFAPQRDADRRRAAVAAWSRRVGDALSSPAAAPTATFHRLPQRVPAS